MKLIQFGYNLDTEVETFDLWISIKKLIQLRQKEYETLSEFPCKLIQFVYKSSKISSSLNFHTNWYKRARKSIWDSYNLDKKLNSLNLNINWYYCARKSIRNWYTLDTKILKFFDLSEFSLKVYEIHTIWIQKFKIVDLWISITLKYMKLIQFGYRLYERDITWIQNLENSWPMNWHVNWWDCARNSILTFVSKQTNFNGK